MIAAIVRKRPAGITASPAYFIRLLSAHPGGDESSAHPFGVRKDDAVKSAAALLWILNVLIAMVDVIHSMLVRSCGKIASLSENSQCLCSTGWSRISSALSSVLAIAAFLEAWGDSFFQSAFYRSAGASRVLSLFCGVFVLALYGSTVNLPRWDFGKLLGVYVVLFFLAAQLLAKLRFGQSPTTPIYVGGSLILLGGCVVAFWKA